VHTIDRRLPNMVDLLEANGFRVRGKRAECVHCSGHSRLTVAFTESVAFCHRCRWTASLRRLAKEQGCTVPQRKMGRARVRKHEFQTWLGHTYAAMADQEHKLARTAMWAMAALHYFPDMESAWDALATWYHAQRSFSLFFEAAQDRLGRYTLYRAWRCANA